MVKSFFHDELIDIIGAHNHKLMLHSVSSFLRIKAYLLVLITVLINGSYSYAQSVSLKGNTVDQHNSLPVPYVSIGIVNKPIGTVSDSLGRYTLSYLQSEVKHTDTIAFSAIGYRSLRMDWNTFLKNGQVVKLAESPHLLKSVSISAKPGKLKNYGRSSAGIIFFPAMYKNIPKTSDEKGREQAVMLKIDKDIFLRKLNFSINRKNFKKIKLRMNIYAVRDGLPGQSILRKDVIFEVAGNTKVGMQAPESIDLKPYQIHIQGRKEIAVALAILDLEAREGDTSKTAFFIPSFPGPLRSSLYRMKGQAQWQKVSNSNLLVAIEASSRKNASRTADNDSGESEAETIQHDTSLVRLMYGNSNGKRIQIEDGEIYYETYGKGSPLILLHGNNESIGSFRNQIGPLSQYYKVIAIDTRGQGNSINKKTSAYTYEQFAKDLEDVMHALSIKKASLLGWSDGGNTALLFSLRHPERLEKMIVVGANLFPGPDAIEDKVVQLFEKRRDSLLHQADPESRNRLRLTELVLKEPHIRAAALSTVSIPVLVVAGQFDVVKKEHTELIHSHLKNSRLEIIPGGDHYSPLKQTETFNRLVLDFLNGAEATDK